VASLYSTGRHSEDGVAPVVSISTLSKQLAVLNLLDSIFFFFLSFFILFYFIFCFVLADLTDLRISTRSKQF
jgi:hypothetical protein